MANYTTLNKEMKAAALAQPNVNTYTEGDVYVNWHNTVTYAAVNMGLESVSYNDSTATYNIVLYYADRLTKDDSNKLAIYDDGTHILRDIISALPDEIEYSTPISFTQFEQQFEDVLAGCYARIALTMPYDAPCGLDVKQDEEYILDITKNGEYNVKTYDYVNVDVQPNLTYKLIEENGIFVPKGSDGFNVVEVNVHAGGDGITEEECREIVEGYNYATEQWVEDKGYLTEHQDLSDYVTKDELDAKNYSTKEELEEVAVEVFEGLPEKITQMQHSIEDEVADNYAKKDEIPDMDNYYSKVSNMDIKQTSSGHPSITLSANTGAKAVLGDSSLEIKDADGKSRASVSQSGITWHSSSNSAQFTVGSNALHYGVTFEDRSYIIIELNPSGRIVKKTKTADGVEKVEQYISEAAFEYDEATQTLNINI